MEVQYSPEVQQQADRLTLLEQASALLTEILGPQSSLQVNAKWSRVQDHQSRTLYRLTIWDWTGEVFTDFAPDELDNPAHLKFRLYRLWGDLLQVRNDHQHQQVQHLSGLITTG